MKSFMSKFQTNAGSDVRSTSATQIALANTASGRVFDTSDTSGMYLGPQSLFNLQLSALTTGQISHRTISLVGIDPHHLFSNCSACNAWTIPLRIVYSRIYYWKTKLTPVMNWRSSWTTS